MVVGPRSAGGVGSAAMQLGKAFGARIIAATGSAEKMDFCLTQARITS